MLPSCPTSLLLAQVFLWSVACGQRLFPQISHRIIPTNSLPVGIVVKSCPVKEPLTIALRSVKHLRQVHFSLIYFPFIYCYAKHQTIELLPDLVFLRSPESMSLPLVTSSLLRERNPDGDCVTTSGFSLYASHSSSSVKPFSPNDLKMKRMSSCFSVNSVTLFAARWLVIGSVFLTRALSGNSS